MDGSRAKQGAIAEVLLESNNKCNTTSSKKLKRNQGVKYNIDGFNDLSHSM